MVAHSKDVVMLVELFLHYDNYNYPHAQSQETILVL